VRVAKPRRSDHNALINNVAIGANAHALSVGEVFVCPS